MRSHHWGALAQLLVLLAASSALARPLTLSPVGSPIPGVGPVGLAVAEVPGATFVVRGDYQGNAVTSLRIDRATGTLTPIGSVPVNDGPSAFAVSRNGRFVVVSSLRSNNMGVLSIDPATGALRPVGSPVPSGGTGPVDVAITDNGHVIVANRDSDQLGVLRLDRHGALYTVDSQTVGRAPAHVLAVGNSVLVGHATSNDVHLLRVDRHGALYTVDSQVVGARISAMAIGPGPVVYAGTYPNGDVHAFAVEPHRLVPLGSTPTGGDLTALAVAHGGTAFVAGIVPARVAAFGFAAGINPARAVAVNVARQGLQPVGSAAMNGVSSRTLATVPGPGGTTFVIVNEYNNNRTLVLDAH